MNAGEPPETKGAIAERLVVERIRAVLPPTIAVIAQRRAGFCGIAAYVREGEADVVIGDPERGILVIEVKSGEIRRDSNRHLVGRCPNRADPQPVRAGRRQPYELVRKLTELPGWPAGLDPIAGQAVAFPDVELDSMRDRLGLLGPDVDTDLIADQSMFIDNEVGRPRARPLLSIERSNCGAAKTKDATARQGGDRPARGNDERTVRDLADAPQRDRGGRIERASS